MTSYTSELSDDTLHLGFNNGIFVQGDRIVRDAEAQLNALMAAGRLTGGKLIQINGRTPLLVSYVLAHKLMDLYEAIALFVPSLNAYIVVKSDTPDYPIASRIDAGRVTLPSAYLDPASKPSFLLNWHGDVLKAQLNGEIEAQGDRLVLDTYTQLQTLIDSGQLPGGNQTLLINGRAPISTGFVIGCRVAHLYDTVAVFDPKVLDPKIGERGLNQYVVTITHGQHRLGDLLNVPGAEPPKRPQVIVAICGFPNTGKTCLHYGLKKALHQIPDIGDTYVISGCPDGEGSWFSETARQNPELARKLKDQYKTKFTPEFAAAKAREIAAIPNSLLVFDVGGKISQENRTIMSQASHAVILANSDKEVDHWQGFCQELNLKVVAILYSDYHGTIDRLASPEEYRLECESPILKGSVHHLDRKEDVSSRPMVQKLARVLADLTIAPVESARG